MVVGEMVVEVALVVVGGGPGGYTAALRAAELGIKTMLVDAQPKPGGVCLHMGCIPSKALLHAAEVINTARHAKQFGIEFQAPKINLDELRGWKEKVQDKLADGITGMLKGAKVEHLVGRAQFLDSRSLRVDRDGENAVRVKFKHAILAAGSRPLALTKLFTREEDANSPLVLNSTSALNVSDIPGKLLVVGGGYIGLEMGSVYHGLGSKVTVVELTDGLLPGVDRDLVKPLAAKLGEDFEKIYLSTKVASLEVKKDKVVAQIESGETKETLEFDKVMISIGRVPNTDGLGLENTDVEIDDHGFAKIDQFCRTRDKRILAIGDVSGQPMLAHRAIRQGFVAAEVLAGKSSSYDNRACPAVVFTEPEVAWCGLTENEAKREGVKVQVARFPWSASGRAMTLGQPSGTTKVLFCPETMRVLGVGVAGSRAGDLIAEAVLAIEMGATLEDLACTIHAHPTLSETINEAAIAGLSRMERQKAKEVEKVK